MSLFCTSCQSPLAADARFCGYCGTPTTAERPSVAPATFADHHGTAVSAPAQPTFSSEAQHPQPPRAFYPRVTVTSSSNTADRVAVTASPEQAAWWTTVACGALILLSGFMPWATSNKNPIYGSAKVSTSHQVGFAAGPTAWFGMALALAAAAVALSQVRATVRLPWNVTRPAASATYLAAGALACILIRSMSLTRPKATLVGLSSTDPSAGGGAVLANLAAVVMVAATGFAARQASVSLAPRLGWSLATTGTPAMELDSAVPARGRPREVTASAVLCFVVAGITALVALTAFVLSAGMSSISILHDFGALVAAAGIIPAALAVWLIVVALQLLKCKAWSRTACLITLGLMGGVSLLGVLTMNSDPTIGLLLTLSCAVPLVLLCTASARRTTWS